MAKSCNVKTVPFPNEAFIHIHAKLLKAMHFFGRYLLSNK